MTDLAHDLARLWPAALGLAAECGFDVPQLTETWILSTPREIPESLDAEVVAAIRNGLGWARFRSAAWDGLGEEPGLGERGPLLWAEWRDVADEAVSFRLSPDPTNVGASLIRRFCEGEGEGANACLAQDVSLLGRAPGRPALYRVYWGASAPRPFEMRRLFSRFVGFGESP